MTVRQPPTLYGRQVIVSPLVQPVPVLQVSPTFEWCSDAARSAMNAYLLERFGTVEPVYELPDGKLVMSTGMYRQMRRGNETWDRYSKPPQADMKCGGKLSDSMVQAANAASAMADSIEKLGQLSPWWADQ